MIMRSDLFYDSRSTDYIIKVLQCYAGERIRKTFRPTMIE